jgi:ribonuclease E
VRDNESLALSILRLIEEEALKENTKEVHAIVPVPVASYLLNEKREAVSAIESRQAGVRCIIVPNDQMQTPHYSVLRVRKGEETSTLSYLLPKLHEEEMAMPSDDEPAERKLPEQPALATFIMPEAPPAPSEQQATVKPAAQKSETETRVTSSEPGLLGRIFSALKKMFAGEEAQPEEPKVAPKEEKQERPQQDRRKRQNNRRDRNDRRDNRDNRDNRSENSEGREAREDNRRNRREKPQQHAEDREIHQPAGDESEKSRQRDEQQPRRERNRRRNDDKRQAQQEVKAVTLEEPAVQEAEQEERVQVMPRRKQRQLSQKVRFESEQTEAVTTVVSEPAVEETQNTQLAKLDLPSVVEPTPEQDDNAEARDNNGMPRRSRRSPRHLRVSGQRRRRYRDERYPTQSPMPMTVACVSPEMASGKVWIRYPIARPQDQQFEEQTAVETVEPMVAAPVAAEEVQHVVAEPQTVEAVDVETTHPEVIAAPVDAQPHVIAQEDTAVAEQIAEAAEPATPTDTFVEQPAVAEVKADVVAEVEAEAVADVVAEAEQPAPAVVAEQPVVEVKPQPAAPAVVGNHYATAPMTRAPAPEYQPEAPRQSDWVRPAFDFEGKGSAGGHSATHHATAPATRPQSVD